MERFEKFDLSEFDIDSIGEIKIRITVKTSVTKPRHINFKFNDLDKAREFLNTVRESFAGANGSVDMRVYADGLYIPKWSTFIRESSLMEMGDKK